MPRSTTVVASPNPGRNDHSHSRSVNGHRRVGSIIRAVLLAMVCTGLGCGAPPPLSEVELFKEANAEFERGQFSLASSHYEELLEQHPFSDLAEIARLRIAHSYYLNGSYDKSIAAFNDFERLHPASPLMGFVEYTIAKAHLDQVRPADRDKSAARNAMRQFSRVQERYSGTLYGRLAQFRITECEEILASHELVVGDYYKRVGKNSASIRRYSYLIDTYPNSDAAVLGRERLAESGALGTVHETTP
jgi:outer membrane protein assembly factor BamD